MYLKISVVKYQFLRYNIAASDGVARSKGVGAMERRPTLYEVLKAHEESFLQSREITVARFLIIRYQLGRFAVESIKICLNAVY